MTDQVDISNIELRAIILRLAKRHDGVGVVDLTLAGIGIHRARNTLDKMACESKLHRARGGWSGRHVRWFVSELAATQYTNGPRHASPHMPQREIDRHVRLHGIPKRPVVSSGIASGVDQRYQCTPAEAERLKAAGEFSTRRPGVYAEAPASCAARAAK